MMVIRGTTTEHSVAFSTPPTNNPGGIGGNATDLITWVYDDTTELFEPNNALRTLLDSTTNGPWRVVSVSAITRRGNGGAAAPNAGINSALLSHIRFDEASNISLTPGYGAITNTAGDTIAATRGNTQIIHRSAGEASIYPADRCTWRVGPDGSSGYRIDQALFFDGVTAGGTTILNPALGYIGKSGRFVEIAG